MHQIYWDSFFKTMDNSIRHHGLQQNVSEAMDKQAIGIFQVSVFISCMELKFSLVTRHAKR